MRTAVLAITLCLAACNTGQYAGYVGPLDPELGAPIALDMTRFVNGRIKPSDGPIQIEQPVGDQSVGPNLVEDLQSSGFTVVKTGGKHRVRYAANALGADVVA